MMPFMRGLALRIIPSPSLMEDLKSGTETTWMPLRIMKKKVGFVMVRLKGKSKKGGKGDGRNT